MNGDCEYEFEGYDTDGTEWFHCTTHDSIEISPDAPCNGYEEIPYIVSVAESILRGVAA
jgi:hypothetical protein